MERLANLIGALGLALADESARVVSAASGLPVVDAAALNVIGTSPGCTVGHLSTALGFTHPGAVRVVDRLVERRLVRRAVADDRRKVSLTLTEPGGHRWAEQSSAREEWLDGLMARVSPDVREPFTSAVESLLVALTRSEDQGEVICRLCDEQACPQDRCPVTLAALP